MLEEHTRFLINEIIAGDSTFRIMLVLSIVKFLELYTGVWLEEWRIPKHLIMESWSFSWGTMRNTNWQLSEEQGQGCNPMPVGWFLFSRSKVVSEEK